MNSTSGDQSTNIIGSPHAPLLPNVSKQHGSPARTNRLRPMAVFLILFGILAFAFLVGPKDSKRIYEKLSSMFIINDPSVSTDSDTYRSSVPSVDEIPATVVARGVAEGVSAKSYLPLRGLRSFSWPDRTLNWQRTSFHFQPKNNWMNDPNGPMLYKGWYHFFYQYNPDGPVWGNIVWGHAVSKDLIHWDHLPIAMTTDQWYDINGVWTGSATLLSNGQLVMLYTGSTNETVQVQNLAYPEDPSDPLLLKWVKYPGNPVLVPPPGIHFQDFRDPTTAWTTSDGKWRFIIGSKLNNTGISLVYDTVDFKTFQLSNMVLHAVPGTGMWECVDFYPVSSSEENGGLDTSDNGPAVKHVMKVSLDDDRNDYYAIGIYDEATGTWVPDDPSNDVGIGLRYDYGTFYASKTFFDPQNKRRILWSWITEKDSEAADIKKGWASLQAIPRTIALDKKTGTNLVQWPVEEVEKLRLDKKIFDNVVLETGTIVPLDLHSATQLDIIAEFEINELTSKNVTVNELDYSCSTSNGAAQRGALGPFGLLVLTDNDQIEQTPIYFYVTKAGDGNVNTFFCVDQSRSSKAYDVEKKIYGSTVPVLNGEKLSIRILVDHSIVESFSQGGRTCITSRVYPTKSIYDEARLYLFNNATDAKITASVKVWQMAGAAPKILILGSRLCFCLLNLVLYIAFL